MLMAAMRIIPNQLRILFYFYVFISSPLAAMEITFSCPQGQVVFKVEIAQTPQELAKGLMNREALAQDEGMLFLFPESQPATMWMKDTPLSLDMLFIDQKGKILAIEEKTTPYSLKHIGPIENTAKVLELLEGTVKKTGISKECTLKL